MQKQQFLMRQESHYCCINKIHRVVMHRDRLFLAAFRLDSQVSQGLLNWDLIL